MLRRSYLLLILAMMLPVAAAHAQTAAPGPAFAPGQVWSLKSTPPTTAKVIIDRVEPWRDTTVVHVSIIDVPVPKGLPGAGGTTSIGHAPFDKAALAASVDRLIQTGVPPAPEFEAGYKRWQSDHGGIYTLTVPQAIDALFATLSRTNG